MRDSTRSNRREFPYATPSVHDRLEQTCPSPVFRTGVGGSRSDCSNQERNMKRFMLRSGRQIGRIIAWALPAICLAQGQFQCQRTDLPVTLLSEGMTELVSDVVLKCTGGTPTNAGAAVPRYQIMLTSSTPLASRILVPGTPGTGTSEALLIIDDPDFARQNGCLTNVSGDSCPAISGDQTNPNVFQSRQIQ